MTLRNMIDTLLHTQLIEVRDNHNMELFICSSNSPAIEPYLDKRVMLWFAGHAPHKTSDFVVLLGE